MTGQRFCTSCGAARIEGARFCGGCGADFEVASAVTQPAVPADPAPLPGGLPTLASPGTSSLQWRSGSRSTLAMVLAIALVVVGAAVVGLLATGHMSPRGTADGDASPLAVATPRPTSTPGQATRTPTPTPTPTVASPIPLRWVGANVETTGDKRTFDMQLDLRTVSASQFVGAIRLYRNGSLFQQNQIAEGTFDGSTLQFRDSDQPSRYYSAKITGLHMVGTVAWDCFTCGYWGTIDLYAAD